MAAASKGITPRQAERLCAAWPGVTTDIKWGAELVFSVGGKMFLVMPENGGRLAFKVEDERFLELSDQPGMIAAPYLARARWIQVVEPQRFATKELSELIRTAYGLIRRKLTKKLQAELGEWPLPEEKHT
ncbi:MmcQ/YjbR family DNA-binding protein [Dyella telluris]|uniref:MmcQ/YjbR family DNA-binding protein n=1 Tax=Dyella telluris TaxID=2763498 RepID=A0A7G8Q5K1_9GAMM|nr:MmcQ/YjbR family DNA-binding protein [Dyella telluris]QNK02059.1 MmcQ/YjbR family DNA-binding protein [Dyella telluris]